MTRIDFYILASSVPQASELFSCRLTEKTYNLGHKIYIHTSGEAQSRKMDQLLWTFKQSSFVPHGIDGECPDESTPVLLGHQTQLNNPTHRRAVLINLAPTIPLFFSSFERVAELVSPDEKNKIAGRERYRFYRERGYTLKNHNIDWSQP